MYLNLYKDGDDYCPYHTHPPNYDSFIFSLGMSRDFLLKHNEKGSKATKYQFDSGDIFYLPKDIHINHKHSVPKRKNIQGTRISILLFVIH